MLAPYWPLFVGVQCTVGVAEQCDRGDRGPRGARFFTSRVHRHGLYDLEVHSAAASPAECAAGISAALGPG
jgi:chloramphenicol 3-O-phosphotransferase